jgi:acetyl esterase/lipase
MKCWRPPLGVLAAATMLTAAGPSHPVEGLDWPDLLSRPHAKAQAHFSYGPSPAQVVDLWLPQDKGPHPVVVLIHGGCWIKAYAGRNDMDYAAEALRQRGIAVWNIEYRGIDEPGGGYPGTFQDVGAAVDLLAVEGPKHGLKLDNVIALGHSAGGHLALWAAARPQIGGSSPLHAAHPLAIASAVSLGGLGDLETLARTKACGGSDTVARLVGPPSAQHPDVYADTSPLRLEPFPARQILIHGAADTLAPPDPFGVAYRDGAKRRGGHAELQIIPGANHIDLIAPGTRAWSEIEALTSDLVHRRQ